MMGITGFLFSVCGEKKPDNGEDSFVYALNESRAMVGVFDGGPGAGQSPALKGKSGGYLASRAAAAAWAPYSTNVSAPVEPSAAASGCSGCTTDLVLPPISHSSTIMSMRAKGSP